jgi:hypothetical protein
MMGKRKKVFIAGSPATDRSAEKNNDNRNAEKNGFVGCGGRLRCIE